MHIFYLYFRIQCFGHDSICHSIFANSISDASYLFSPWFEDIYKMVCSENVTIVNITIPVVLIPKSGGVTLNKCIADGKKGESLRFMVLSSAFILWLSNVLVSVLYLDCWNLQKILDGELMIINFISWGNIFFISKKNHMLTFNHKIV